MFVDEPEEPELKKEVPAVEAKTLPDAVLELPAVELAEWNRAQWARAMMPTPQAPPRRREIAIELEPDAPDAPDEDEDFEDLLEILAVL